MVFLNFYGVRKFNSSLVAVLRKSRVSFPFNITILHESHFTCLTKFWIQFRKMIPHQEYYIKKFFEILSSERENNPQNWTQPLVGTRQPCVTSSFYTGLTGTAFQKVFTNFNPRCLGVRLIHIYCHSFLLRALRFNRLFETRQNF